MDGTARAWSRPGNHVSSMTAQRPSISVAVLPFVALCSQAVRRPFIGGANPGAPTIPTLCVGAGEMSRKSRPEFPLSNETLKQRLLGRQLDVVTVVAIVIFLLTQLRAIDNGFKPINIAQALFCCALVGASVRRHYLGLEVAASVVSVVILLWCAIAAINYGILAPGHLAVPFVIVFSSIVYGRPVALKFFWAATAGMALIGTLFLTGAIRYQVDIDWYVHSWTSWVILIVLQMALAAWYLFLIAPINDAARKTTEHLEAVLQGINDALFIHDKDTGAILQVNQKTCSMYGYSAEEFLRMSIGDLSAGVPPYAQVDAQGWLDRAANLGPQLFEWWAKNSEGKLFWVEVNMRRATLGGAERLLVLVRDVSARKRAERDLRQIQANMAALIESTNDLIWSVDLDNRCLAFNRSAQEHIRQTYGAEIGVDAPLERVMPADRSVVWTSLFARALAEGSFRQELSLSSGRVHDVALNPITSGDENVGVSVFARDITDRKQAEEAVRESERKTRAIFDLSFGFLGLLTPDGALVEANKTALDFAGVAISDVEGKPFWDTPWWSHSSEAQEIIRTAVRRAALGQLVHTEAVHRARDGSLRVIEFTLKPVKDDSGLVTHLIPEGRDVTEQRKALEELRASEEKFSKLFQSSPDAVLLTKLDGGTIVEANRAFEVLSGYSRTELLGRNAYDFDLVTAADREFITTTIRTQGRVRDAGFNIKQRSGAVATVQASLDSIEFKGEPHAITILHDVTERKRAEERQTLLLATIDVALDGVYWMDPDGRFTYVNAAGCGMLGYTQDELLNLRIFDVNPLVDAQRWLEIWAFLQKNKHLVTESVHRRKDGSEFPVELASTYIESGNKTYVNGFARDITERQRAAIALSKSEERYRAIVDQAADGIFIMDLQGKLVQVNPSFARAHGYTVEELLARGLDGITVERPPPAPGRIQRLMAGESLTFEVEHRRKDGTRFPLEVTSSLVEYAGVQAIIAFHRDLTERKRAQEESAKLEAQLRQAQKMESIGQLAGGVAHDFNNLLSVILYHTEFAAEGIAEDSPVVADLLEVTKATDRAVALTRQLLAFSRKQVLKPVSTSLNAITIDVEKMLRRVLGEDITIVRTLHPDLGMVHADPDQIGQVLLNLAVNARDAMPDGGKLTIETSNIELDDDYVAQHLGLAPGAYVQLAVSDTGCGMDETTKARIFEPFFTTKEKGRGTGLGLSTVYGIVKQSGGGIWVYSELGLGTSFKIFFPQEVPTTAETATAPSKSSILTKGTETILVVEDEESLRNATNRILATAGYAVLLAANGEEALQVSAEHRGAIHLLLTDVVMPKMNGRVLAEQLLRSRPEVKIVYVSGYTDNAIVHHGVLDSGTHFLNKPVSAAVLTRKIRDVLDG